MYRHDHYTYIYTYACRIITTTQWRRVTQFFRKIYLSLYLKGFERVTKGFFCVRGELKTEQNCNILTPTLMAITAFLSRSPGLLNRGPLWDMFLIPASSPQLIWTSTVQSGAWGPPLLSAGFLYRILSPTDWISCAPNYIIIWGPLFFLTISYSIQPVHGQGYILIFLDRMDLLFTQMQFLFLSWPGSICYILMTERFIHPLISHLQFIFCIFTFQSWV